MVGLPTSAIFKLARCPKIHRLKIKRNLKFANISLNKLKKVGLRTFKTRIIAKMGKNMPKKFANLFKLVFLGLAGEFCALT